MYNLFRFFVRYHLFILFISLEFFCFYLIYRSKQYNNAAYLNTANAVSGKVYKSYRGASEYLYLRKINDSLIAENIKLHEKLAGSVMYIGTDSMQMTDTTKKYVQLYTYVPARVIRNSVNHVSNLIYLDKGSLQGVDKQMGVVNANGIVGQVVSVTDNYAAAMSVLSKDFKVSAKLKKNEYFGNLHWEGVNSVSASLEEIPKHVPAKIGDTIVTSGFSELFPRDIMVGTISKVNVEPDKNFLDITVSLSTDFGSLNHVYVVKNLKRSELNLLDDTVNKHD